MKRNSIILVLDDMRSLSEVRQLNPNLPEGKEGKEIVIVRSADEFKAWINENGLPKYISWDIDLLPIHYADLGKPCENDGIQCLIWLMEKVRKEKMDMPFGFIHSMNHIKRERGNHILRNYKDWRILTGGYLV